MRPYLTVREAAEQLGLSRTGVQARILSGHMQADRYGRQWLLPREEVERWLQKDAFRWHRKHLAPPGPRAQATSPREQPEPPTATPGQVKRCGLCGVTKPVSEMVPDRNSIGGYRALCKACNRARSNAWIKAHEGWRRANQRIYWALKFKRED
jgi:excisionase family DNA binding protein